MTQSRSTRSGIVDVVKGTEDVLVDVGGDVGKVGEGTHDVLGEQFPTVVGEVVKQSFGNVGKGAHEGVGIVEQVG